MRRNFFLSLWVLFLVCPQLWAQAKIQGFLELQDFLESASLSLMADRPGAAQSQAARGLVSNAQQAPQAPPERTVLHQIWEREQGGQLTEDQKRAVALATEYLKRHPELLAQQKVAAVPEVEAVWITTFHDRDSFAYVTFSRQQHESIPVEGTEVRVNLRNGQVQDAKNSWYKAEDIKGVSTKPQKSEEEIRQALVGLELSYSGMVGQINKVKLTKEDLKGKGELTILPEKKGGKTSFRLVWKIKAGQRLSWMLYVDAATGQVVKKRQLFFTLQNP